MSPDLWVLPLVFRSCQMLFKFYKKTGSKASSWLSILHLIPSQGLLGLLALGSHTTLKIGFNKSCWVSWSRSPQLHCVKTQYSHFLHQCILRQLFICYITYSQCTWPGAGIFGWPWKAWNFNAGMLNWWQSWGSAAGPFRCVHEGWSNTEGQC